MPRRTRTARRERLLEHGYWDHVDPAVTLKQMLARHPQRLARFAAAYDEEDGDPGLLLRWAELEGVPTPLMRVIRRAYAGTTEPLFDGVEVATGSGPDLGGMITWGCVLVAYRREGWIHYRVRGDGIAPKPTRMPLPIDDVFSVVAGDPYAVLDHAPDVVAACLTTSTPTRRDLAETVDRVHWTTHVASPFYDFTQLTEGIRDGVLQALLERFGLATG